ncbi:vWA domain-containing protein [Micromonospora tulbaghiae]|uniref:Uncharacterized conserved protein YegL, contains vWA domain of TerY type n=1 Tax=Micromonospora tulbaghiae TaxID=479978 RepID=A0ABY0KGW1_9ACTN|nr:hypothetical protein [Micromonospora tulbaghiae]SCE68967.1 Uncharacterized conserved protein YegL, contains vWA domain of TerY type [Micromonospora tulbaghiae]
MSQAVEGQVVMPFYVLCDVSGSMWADMPALNAGLAQLRQAIMRDPVVDDLAMMSVIAFADTAHTVVPLSFPSQVEPPTLVSGGLTNFGPAFREFHRAFEADRIRLKSEGKRIFRPCVFFLTDGEPTDGDYAQVFASLLRYDVVTKQGNPRYPYVTAFGFREATAETMQTLTYPDFGEKRGRYFLAREGAVVSEILSAIAGAIATSIVGSALSTGSGKPQYMPPAKDSVGGMKGSLIR